MANNAFRRYCWDTTFASEVPPEITWESTPLTLAEAMLGFFSFYATLDLEHKMVSISDGGVIDRRFAWQSRVKSLPNNADKRHNHPPKWKSHL
jgi:hypothetical protein